MSKVFGIGEAEISAASSQDTVEKWDSLGHMNLVVALEEEFGFTFKDEQVVELLNYALICEVVKESLGGR
jgi:acyl carrier protein